MLSCVFTILISLNADLVIVSCLFGMLIEQGSDVWPMILLGSHTRVYGFESHQILDAFTFYIVKKILNITCSADAFSCLCHYNKIVSCLTFGWCYIPLVVRKKLPQSYLSRHIQWLWPEHPFHFEGSPRRCKDQHLLHAPMVQEELGWKSSKQQSHPRHHL